MLAKAEQGTVNIGVHLLMLVNFSDFAFEGADDVPQGVVVQVVLLLQVLQRIFVYDEIIEDVNSLLVVVFRVFGA